MGVAKKRKLRPEPPLLEMLRRALFDTGWCGRVMLTSKEEEDMLVDLPEEEQP